MSKAGAHADNCEWHLDQYDFECTCGAVPNPEEIKPQWLKAPHSLAMGKRRRGASLQDRFDRLTFPEPNSGCLLWIGATTKAGYGIMKIDGRTVPATHVALELAGLARPSDLFACHKCDNPSCVRHDHLFWGSHDANMADQKAKARHWATRATACKQGHAWTPENTRIGADGRKNCRTCEQDRLARRRVKRAARNQQRMSKEER